MADAEDVRPSPPHLLPERERRALKAVAHLVVTRVLPKWRWWLPLLAAGIYLASLAVNFPRLIQAVYWNSDLAFMPLLAEDLQSLRSLRSAGEVNMGNTPYYSTLWFLLMTKPLPAYRLIWAVGPYLLALAAVGLMAWSAWRVAGRWAALMTLAIAVGAGGLVLLTLLPPGARVITWFANAALGACLVFLASTRGRTSRSALLLVGLGTALLAGTTAGSDPLFLISGLGPFLGAAAIVALLDRDRESAATLIVASSICAGSIAIGVLTAWWMGSLGFTATYPGAGFEFATQNELLTNVRTLVTDILVMGSGLFLGLPVSPISVAMLVAGVVALVAAGCPVVMLTRVLRRDSDLADGRGLRLFVSYWSLAAVGVAGSLVLTTNALEMGIASARYTVPIFYSVAALAPVWAGRSGGKQALVAASAALFIVLSAYFQRGIPAETSRLALVKEAPQLISFLEGEGLTRGYAAYWDAHALTWNSDMKVRVYPISECRLPESATPCPFHIAIRESWYRPAEGRTFILFNPTAASPLKAVPAPDLGPPSQVRFFGKLAVFVFDYDVASRFTSPS
ncbi:MAG: hypothetical protein M3164_08315 [Actinomycetota bacterium]|nr:hypothetical protein [Actinomycetota bacterium]